jgi:hypothetical protein
LDPINIAQALTSEISDSLAIPSRYPVSASGGKPHSSNLISDQNPMKHAAYRTNYYTILVDQHGTVRNLDSSKPNCFFFPSKTQNQRKFFFFFLSVGCLAYPWTGRHRLRLRYLQQQRIKKKKAQRSSSAAVALPVPAIMADIIIIIMCCCCVNKPKTVRGGPGARRKPRLLFSKGTKVGVAWRDYTATPDSETKVPATHRRSLGESG